MSTKANNDAYLEVLSDAVMLLHHLEVFLTRVFPEDESRKKALLASFQARVADLLHADRYALAVRYARYCDCWLKHLKEKMTPWLESFDEPWNEITTCLDVLEKSSQRHLKNQYNTWNQILGTWWLSLDIGLLVTSVCLGFLNPSLGLPVLVITFFSLGYSLFDVGKDAIKFNSYQPIQREVAIDIDDSLLQVLKKQYPKLDVSELLNVERQHLRDWLEERNQYRRLSFVLAVIGLVFAGVGIFFLFPPVSIPIAAVIASTLVNGFASLGAVGLFIAKVAHENQLLKKIDVSLGEAKARDSLVIHRTLTSPDTPLSGSKESSTTAKLIREKIAKGGPLSDDALTNKDVGASFDLFKVSKKGQDEGEPHPAPSPDEH